jgi:hypothetical protein
MLMFSKRNLYKTHTNQLNAGRSLQFEHSTNPRHWFFDGVKALVSWSAAHPFEEENHGRRMQMRMRRVLFSLPSFFCAFRSALANESSWEAPAG